MRVGGSHELGQWAHTWVLASVPFPVSWSKAFGVFLGGAPQMPQPLLGLCSELGKIWSRNSFTLVKEKEIFWGT